MVLTTAQIFETLDARRIELGLSQAEVGRRALQQTDGSALQNIKRGSSPSAETLSKLCDALGLEIYIGKPRRDSPSQTHLSEPAGETDFQRADAFRAGYLPLPWLDPAVGSGAAPIAFSYVWMEANGLIPGSLACVVPDQVAAPTVDARSFLAVIDIARAKAGYGLWMIREKGKKIAVRALFEGSSMVIMPDDLEHAPRIIHDWKGGEVVPLGKIVWIGLNFWP